MTKKPLGGLTDEKHVQGRWVSLPDNTLDGINQRAVILLRSLECVLGGLAPRDID